MKVVHLQAFNQAPLLLKWIYCNLSSIKEPEHRPQKVSHYWRANMLQFFIVVDEDCIAVDLKQNASDLRHTLLKTSIFEFLIPFSISRHLETGHGIDRSQRFRMC